MKTLRRATEHSMGVMEMLMNDERLKIGPATPVATGTRGFYKVLDFFAFVRIYEL